MEVLVLSCGTGGGHNTAGIAVAEEMERRGHKVDFKDVYELISKNASQRINNTYIKIAQHTPKLFGMIYAAGKAYGKLPFDSPVYLANGKFAHKLGEYLKNHHYSLIFCTHMFPTHMLKYLKEKGDKIPFSVFIATDYTFHPFTDESDCDIYVIPNKSLINEFTSHGIDETKIKPFGIPVRREFTERKNKKELRRQLEMNEADFYFLVSGGSMGAGCIAETIEVLNRLLKRNDSLNIIAICGNNDHLYGKLKSKYGDDKQIRLLKQTSRMADYMQACDIFLTKPGGLSSTEAAVSGIPLIHISPIPGCETENAEYFAKRKMSVYAENPNPDLYNAVKLICNTKSINEMKLSQRKNMNLNATDDICNYIEQEMCKNIV